MLQLEVVLQNLDQNPHVEVIHAPLYINYVDRTRPVTSRHADVLWKWLDTVMRRHYRLVK